jgi:hypothetical protein
MKSKILLLALLLGGLFCGPAQAHYYIRNDPGGLLDKFIAKYHRLNAKKEKIVVIGFCNSACTLMLGIIPRERVCVRKGATMGFHSSYIWPSLYYRRGTEEMWSYYPDDVRALINSRGWDGLSKHPDIISIDGALIYRRCDGTKPAITPPKEEKLP